MKLAAGTLKLEGFYDYSDKKLGPHYVHPGITALLDNQFNLIVVTTTYYDYYAMANFH